MEQHAWDDKRKYEATFDQLIENHLILMKYLKDNYGEEAIKQYYKVRNEMSFSTRIGKTIKMGAKVLKTISAKKFFSIFLDQMIKNVQYMIPLKCLAGIDQESNRAVIHIENCQTKRVFRRTLRKFKLKDQIDPNAFCEFDCIPTFQLYGAIGDIKVSADFKAKGCDIFAELSEK
jgi:hypothetical protein